MGSLDELIARLVAARGPDRELDAQVWVVTGPTDGVVGLCGFEADAAWHYEYDAEGRFPGDVVEYAVNPDGKRLPQARREAPPFTASIDAALTLLERKLPGWTHGHEKFPANELFNAGGYQFFAAEDHSRLDGGYGHGEARTLPLAICLALLKALRTLAPAQAGGKGGVE